MEDNRDDFEQGQLNDSATGSSPVEGSAAAADAASSSAGTGATDAHAPLVNPGDTQLPGVGTPVTGEDEMKDPASLAPAYAFGATDALESEAVREAMAQRTEVGEEVLAWRRLSTAMLYSAPSVAPSAALGERLRAAIAPASVPIVQKYTGPGAEEELQYLTFVGVNRAVQQQGGKINPLTGKPMSGAANNANATPMTGSAGTGNVRYAPPAAPNSLGARPVMPLVSPPPSASGAGQYKTPQQQTGQMGPGYWPGQSTAAQPYGTQGAPRYPAGNYPAGQYGTVSPASGTRSPTGLGGSAIPAPAKAKEKIPAAFVATPIGEATRKSTPAWYGWAAAAAILLLLVGTNALWINQLAPMQGTQQQLAASQQEFENLLTNARSMQEKIALQEAQLSTVKNDLAEQSTQLAAAQSDLADTQAELVNVRSSMTDTQLALAEAQQLIAQSTQANPDSAMAVSDSVVGALAQGQMDEAMLEAVDPNAGMPATARIVWNPEMASGVLMAKEMPALDEGMAYQLWLLRGGVPTSAGLFTVDANGTGMLEMADMNISDYEVAAITPEPMAGSEAPTGSILIVGEL